MTTNVPFSIVTSVPGIVYLFVHSRMRNGAGEYFLSVSVDKMNMIMSEIVLLTQ
jgi:hypothetical protein